jgi:hypothetical protein
MQIKEIITFFINEATETLEVSFRMESDSEDEVREDFIDLNESKNFGYNFKKNSNHLNDVLEEEEDDFFDDLEDDDIENQEIFSFLSEYYLIYPDKLPKAELF